MVGGVGAVGWYIGRLGRAGRRRIGTTAQTGNAPRIAGHASPTLAAARRRREGSRSLLPPGCASRAQSELRRHREPFAATSHSGCAGGRRQSAARRARSSRRAMACGRRQAEGMVRIRTWTWVGRGRGSVDKQWHGAGAGASLGRRGRWDTVDGSIRRPQLIGCTRNGECALQLGDDCPGRRRASTACILGGCPHVARGLVRISSFHLPWLTGPRRRDMRGGARLHGDGTRRDSDQVRIDGDGPVAEI